MKKIIIIGGGIAGLSAGIYGLKEGYEVEIYEKNSVPGGECMGWNRRGHHIDNCIHWLSGAKEGMALRKIWEEIGAIHKDTEFIKSDKFFTCCVQEQRISLWNDLEKTRKEMIDLSPEDQTEIDKLIDHVKYASACQIPVDKPMDMMNPLDYIKLGKEMADMPKVLKEYGKIDLTELSERFKSSVLKKVFTDYMPGEYSAYSFLVSYAMLAGGTGLIPAGGSLKMSERITERFKELGGKLHLDCSVRKINIMGKRARSVTLSNGQEITADYVISAVDTMELFDKLIGKQYMDKEWQKAYGDENSYPLFSAFQTAFSIDKAAYGETGMIAFDCDPICINGRSTNRVSVKTYEYEPGFAPEGKTVLQSNIMQNDSDYRYWKSLGEEEYREKKKELSQIVEDRILVKFPTLKGHIELIDCFTPMTYERYCNAYHGAYMSFIMKKDVKAFTKKGVIKGLDNVLIASQWLQAPGGLPTAAATGKFAIQRILKKEKKPYII